MPARKKPTSKRETAKAGAPGTMLVPEKLAPLVHYLRHEKVILDSDLAELYGVTTGNLNKAVLRNIDRFPADFMFRLTDDEVAGLRCPFGILNAASASMMPQFVPSNADSPLLFQSGRANPRGGRRTLPYVFTEQGVAMLSSVLRSPRAVEVNIAIMRTFVQLRRLMDSNALLAEKIEALEGKYADHDRQFRLVFDAIKQLIATPSPPAKELGFHTLPSAHAAKKPPRRAKP